MSKFFNAMFSIALILVSVGLSIFTLGAMYWAAGMYFGWTLVFSVTVMSLVVQYLVLRMAFRKE